MPVFSDDEYDDNSSSMNECLSDSASYFNGTSSDMSYNSDDDVIEDEETLSEVDTNECKNMQKFLGSWTTRRGMPLDTLAELLRQLQTHKCFESLPIDPRTVVRTPRFTPLVDLESGGENFHIVLKEGIIAVLKSKPYLIETLLRDGIKIDVNIDGVGVSHSSPVNFWTILCCVKGDDTVFLTTAFHGNTKPVDCNEFLRNFVDEVNDLDANG